MFEELCKRLSEGTVRFTYRKNNGEERQAYGTTKDGVITENGGSLPTGTGSEKKNVKAYYDLDKQGWRSFVIDSLISIDD